MPVLSKADGGSWRRGKIPPYRPLCGAVIADYGGKTRNCGRYLPLRQAQKPPYKSATAAMAGKFDNTGLCLCTMEEYYKKHEFVI